VSAGHHWTLRFAYTWLDTELIEDGVRSGRLSDSASHVGNAELTWAATRTRGWGCAASTVGPADASTATRPTFQGNDRLEYSRSAT
jgi:outer membrane receptor for ferrienterochelin and colicins